MVISPHEERCIDSLINLRKISGITAKEIADQLILCTSPLGYLHIGSCSEEQIIKLENYSPQFTSIFAGLFYFWQEYFIRNLGHISSCPKLQQQQYTLFRTAMSSYLDMWADSVNDRLAFQKKGQTRD